MPEIPSKIKKILFIITQSGYGGAQRFLHTLVARLDPARYAITIASGQTLDQKDFLEKELLNLKIPLRRLKHLVRNPHIYHDFAAVFEIRRLINELAPDTLFLLSSKAGFLGSFVSCFMLHAPRPKVIYRIGGWTFNDPWSWWKRAFWRLLERISAGWKDVIIVNSVHDYDQAGRMNIKPRQQLVLVHNGLDPLKTEFLARDEARTELFKKIPSAPVNLTQTRFFIGIIANMYPTKGLIDLIEAAHLLSFKFQVSSFKIFIIGEGAQRPVLERMIREYGLANGVFLLGRIADAARLLKAFDIFVLSSVKEGFPWVLLEAMAAKIPVIATRVGAVSEMIENGKNGFVVEPSRPEQIAARIRELATSDHLRQEFGIQGHQTVLFKFGLDRMIDGIEQLL